MKTLLIALLSLCVAATDYAADDLSNVPTVNFLDIGKKGIASYAGTVIKVTFGWRQGQLICAKRGKQSGGGKVIVPEAGQAWFATISEKETEASNYSVYLKPSLGSKGYYEMTLVGREIKNGQLVW